MLNGFNVYNVCDVYYALGMDTENISTFYL